MLYENDFDQDHRRLPQGQVGFAYILLLIMALTSCTTMAYDEARLNRYRSNVEFEAFRGMEGQTGAEQSPFTLIDKESFGRDTPIRLYVYADLKRKNDFYLKVKRDLQEWYRFDPAVTIVDEEREATHLLAVSHRDSLLDERAVVSPPDFLAPGQTSVKRVHIRTALTLKRAVSLDEVTTTSYIRSDRIVRSGVFNPERLSFNIVTKREYGVGAWELPHEDQTH